MSEYFVKERIIKILIEKFLPDYVTSDLFDSTLEEAGLDELDRIEFLMDLEKEFDIQIPIEDVSKLTINDIINIVTSNCR